MRRCAAVAVALAAACVILRTDTTTWMSSCDAFSGVNVPSRGTKTSTASTSSLRMNAGAGGGGGRDAEEALRQEIADRNQFLENEERYAVSDREFLASSAVAAIREQQGGLEGADAESSADAVVAPVATTATATAAGEEGGAAPEEGAAADAEAVVDIVDAKRKRLERLVKPRAYPLFLMEKVAEIAESVVDSFGKKLRGGGSTGEAGFYEESFATKISAITTNGDETTNGAATVVLNGSNDNKNKKKQTKERVVILGTGWAAASFLKGIDTDLYDVTVISPRNYFLFTPMLAGASVGTVEYRSITESIREINNKAYYLEGTATEIDPSRNTVVCETVVCDGNSCEIEDFEVEYDRLVVTIGAQTNTFGIPGVREHCCFLKQVEDAQKIRTAIVNCFERANLPSLSEQQRIEKLTFAVIGAGPTGIEFASELRDFVEQDGPKYYPHLLKYVRIKVIEASSTVLAPFDKELQQEAIRQIERPSAIGDPNVRNLLPERFKLTELMLDSSVKEVGEKIISLNDGTELHYGLSVWAAGNGPIPLTLQLIERMGEEQAAQQSVARGRVAIDPWMRVIGGEGKIMALGDCTCQPQNQLPATAQVAAQQGEFLANMMNKRFNLSPPRDEEDGTFLPPVKDPERTSLALSDSIANFATNNVDGVYAKPFQFWNLGILAYTGGGSALAQVSAAPNTPPVKGTGKIGNALWRSVYLSKQVSWRNRVLVLNDWIKRRVFGRDITRL